MPDSSPRRIRTQCTLTSRLRQRRYLTSRRVHGAKQITHQGGTGNTFGIASRSYWH